MRSKEGQGKSADITPKKILIYEFLPEGTTRASVEEVEKMLQRLVDFVTPFFYEK